MLAHIQSHSVPVHTEVTWYKRSSVVLVELAFKVLNEKNFEGVYPLIKPSCESTGTGCKVMSKTYALRCLRTYDCWTC